MKAKRKIVNAVLYFINPEAKFALLDCHSNKKVRRQLSVHSLNQKLGK
jgi:hypothetical protein